jgi:hypothetical protein
MGSQWDPLSTSSHYQLSLQSCRSFAFLSLCMRLRWDCFGQLLSTASGQHSCLMYTHAGRWHTYKQHGTPTRSASFELAQQGPGLRPHASCALAFPTVRQPRAHTLYRICAACLCCLSLHRFRPYAAKSTGMTSGAFASRYVCGGLLAILQQHLRCVWLLPCCAVLCCATALGC